MVQQPPPALLFLSWAWPLSPALVVQGFGLGRSGTSMSPRRARPRYSEASASLKVFDGRMTAEVFSGSGR